MKPQTKYKLRYFGRILLFALIGVILGNAICLIYIQFC
jgi:hypothetical protein